MVVSVKSNHSLAADSVAHCLKDISKIPLLTPSEEIELALNAQAMKKILNIKEVDRTLKQLHSIRIWK